MNFGTPSPAADVPTHISRQDVQHSLTVYAHLLKSVANFQRKYADLAHASVDFANALEAMGQCKGADQSGHGLKVAAELHRVIAKNQELFAETVHKEFEAPLQRNLVAHGKKTDENEKQFEKSMRKMQDEIAKTENRMLKGRKKDLSMFQQSLQEMQRQAQELEEIKAQHLDKVLADEQKNFMFLVQKAAGVVKNEYDHFTAMSMSSRDVTEDLITIAFAPTDKILDAAEKRRVVDKFLGSPAGSAVDNQYDALRRQNSIASSSAASTTANVPVNASVKTGGVVSQNIALLAAASAGRPATPPMTPAVGDGGSFSAGSTTVAANRAYISTMQASATTDGVHARTMSQQSAQSTGTAGGENKSAMDMTSALERLNQAASKLMTEDAENASATANQPATSIDSSTTARASSPQQKAEADLVTAVHDFTARSDRELSFKKNDVLVVKQRQESWLYATHHNQPGSKSGWIPVSYTAAKK